MSAALSEQLALLPGYLSRHLLLSVSALIIGIAISMPLALLATRNRAFGAAALVAAGAVQTIPSLALLALMVPLLRQIGFLPAAIALIVYSVLPILRNSVTGIRSVDPNLLEAGRGLGMTHNQLLLKVQLPLALPIIVAGIRTATIWVVGITTLSTPVGATSLGNYIFSGLQTQNYTAVVVGCAAAASLALILDGMIRLIEIAAARRKRSLLAATVAATVALIIAGLSPLIAGGINDDTRTEIVIGAKTFTEQYILAAVIAERLSDAGFRTRSLESLGSTVAFDGLAAGRIDTYVDYTGTIWTNYMNRSGNPGREAIFDGVAAWLSSEHDVDIVARLGFENAYALAMRRERADALGIRTVADLLAVAPSMTIGGDYEFFSRPEWRELAARYRLEFGELVSMDPTIMYSAVAGGQVDVISAFSTDGRIAAFDLIVLKDTLGALPPYDAVIMVGPGAARHGSSVTNALAELEDTIDPIVMREANKLVDLDGGTVGQAARFVLDRIEAARD